MPPKKKRTPGQGAGRQGDRPNGRQGQYMGRQGNLTPKKKKK